jgi:hypothetical protein
MTIKWNWGTGLIIAYSSFVVFMLGMVYLCTQQHFDLVTEDYYEQELKFQQVIDGKQNEQLLEKQTLVKMDLGVVTVTLPMEKSDGEGKVVFYKPDNANFDKTIALNGSNRVSIPVSELKSGMYTVKATWQSEGKPYYNEQTLFIP